MKDKLIVGIIVAIVLIGVVFSIIMIKNNNEKEETRVKEKLIVSENPLDDECTKEYEFAGINQETEQVNSVDEKISSNSQLILKKYYKECGHTINEYAEMLPELVNLTEEELVEKFQDWNLVKFTTKEVTLRKEFEGSCGEHFSLKEEDGRVVIYKVLPDGTKKLYEETEISTEFLTEPDLIQMQSDDGIQLYGIEELNKVLEDFE